MANSVTDPLNVIRLDYKNQDPENPKDFSVIYVPYLEALRGILHFPPLMRHRGQKRTELSWDLDETALRKCPEGKLPYSVR